MPIHSKNKGKRGELEVAELFRRFGFAARRGQQFQGGADSPDVVVCGLEGEYHVEVKRTETLSIWLAMAQAEHDAARGEVPLVLHRRSKKPWLAILPAEDLLRLLARDKARGKLHDL